MSDESLTSFETPTAQSDESALNRSYTRPGYTFKGLALHPYSHGIDLLFSQVTDLSADTQFYHWAAFLFLLLVRDPELSAIEDRKRHVVPLAWNIAEFRGALIAWLDEVKWTAADSVEAERLFAEIRDEAARAAVEVVGGGKKKPAERSPRRRRS